MNVNVVPGSAYAGQLPSDAAGQARRAPPAPPPGPPPGEAGFVGSIGAALESLGVTDVAAGDKEGAANALGGFLQELMASLHEQGEANGAAQQGPGGNGAGGPGRLAQDLQSLIASLQDDAQETGGASPLESSFATLLGALGADSGDARAKLATFLQSLADQLPQSGSSGNLINTMA